MATLTYETLINEMNQAMLAGDEDRVPLLRQVLAAVGQPDAQAPIIHVVGTNGKGSTVTLMADTLIAAGHKVGVFMSPAISDQREQIVINGQMIGKEDFVRLYQTLLPTVKKIVPDDSPLTIFEWEVVIALTWFAEQHVDWMIIEAGLGGLMDATNAITSPRFSVFTHVALDHTRILGDTIAKIARNKAGIIKPTTTVVIAPGQNDDAKRVIEQTSARVHVPVMLAGKQTWFDNPQFGLDGTTVDVHWSSKAIWHHVHLNLAGQHQLANAATALTVLKQVAEHDSRIDEDAVRTGFNQAALPGRLTTLAATDKHPRLLVDGAHNPDGIQSLVRLLKQVAPTRRFTFVLGFLADKNVAGMLAELLPLAKQVVLTVPDQHQRALPIDALNEMVGDTLAKLQLNDVAVFSTATARDALACLRKRSVEPPVIVTGSFYLIRALREAGLND